MQVHGTTFKHIYMHASSQNFTQSNETTWVALGNLALGNLGDLQEAWKKVEIQIDGQTDMILVKLSLCSKKVKILLTYPQIFQRFSCWIRLVFVDFIGMGILILLPWLLFDMIPWSCAHVVTLSF